jgi:hypothetical protein
MEWGSLGLWRFTDLAEHLAGSCEVEAALRLQLAKSGEDVMCSIDVGRHRGKAVSEAFSDEALRRQMIAFVKAILGKHLKDGRIILQSACV